MWLLCKALISSFIFWTSCWWEVWRSLNLSSVTFNISSTLVFWSVASTKAACASSTLQELSSRSFLTASFSCLRACWSLFIVTCSFFFSALSWSICLLCPDTSDVSFVSCSERSLASSSSWALTVVVILLVHSTDFSSRECNKESRLTSSSLICCLNVATSFSLSVSAADSFPWTAWISADMLLLVSSASLHFCSTCCNLSESELNSFLRLPRASWTASTSAIAAFFSFSSDTSWFLTKFNSLSSWFVVACNLCSSVWCSCCVSVTCLEYRDRASSCSAILDLSCFRVVSVDFSSLVLLASWSWSVLACFLSSSRVLFSSVFSDLSDSISLSCCAEALLAESKSCSSFVSSFCFCSSCRESCSPSLSVWSWWRGVSFSIDDVDRSAFTCIVMKMRCDSPTNRKYTCNTRPLGIFLSQIHDTSYAAPDAISICKSLHPIVCNVHKHSIYDKHL